MDPQRGGQDVVRCSLCTNPVALMHCNVCHLYLCKDCVEEHVSDKSTVHKVVSLKQYLSTICPIHSNKQCELYCAQCDIPICSLCTTSKMHTHHDVVDVMDNFKNKQKYLKRDLQEFEKSILPNYQEMASSIKVQRSDIMDNSEEITVALKKQREVWHREIDTIILNLQSEFNTKNSQCLDLLQREEDKINNQIKEISQSIDELKRLFDSEDVYLVSKYKSETEQFKTLPPKPKIVLPNFEPQKINREQILKMFGSLSTLSLETEEQCYTSQSLGAELSPPDRPLLDVPRIITEINTGYVSLYGVTCFDDEFAWTCGSGDILKLYNITGKLLKSAQSKSGKRPFDIAVKKSGELVYSDYDDSSINIVSKTELQKLIDLQGWIWTWKPRGICATSADELLVIMDSYDDTQTKVVRYSSSTEKQNIQWDDQGQPLFSSGGSKFLCENRNLDICVSDYGARAVVVVSVDGKLRFRYTSPPSTTYGTLDPRGITTDSQGRILVTDVSNHRIHIMDKEGNFLRFIDNCSLFYPFGLDVDSNDNLLVAECRTVKVKKIQYCFDHCV